MSTASGKPEGVNTHSVHPAPADEHVMRVQAGAAVPDIDIWKEPIEEILLLGLLRHDTGVLAQILNKLPADHAGYRGNLRVLLSTARSIQRRVIVLLGEGDGE